MKNPFLFLFPLLFFWPGVATDDVVKASASPVLAPRQAGRAPIESEMVAGAIVGVAVQRTLPVAEKSVPVTGEAQSTLIEQAVSF
ncbi:MAG: hypothetical protein ABIZ81_09085 [Opitutaceae bacterium]